MPDASRADPKSVVTCGNARFTVLTDRLIRLEWAEDGVFEDRATFAVMNRRLPAPAFTSRPKGDGYIIDTGALVLEWTGGAFSPRSLTIRLTGGRKWRFGSKDTGNLGGTRRTLDGYKGPAKEIWKPGKNGGPWYGTGEWKPVPVPDGLLSTLGWTVHDDSTAPIICDEAGEGWVEARPAGARKDLYFLGYGRDFQSCLKDASLVFGRQPLPPRYALGYWYSKYWCYTDRELEQLADDFARRDLPIDVLVVDMDWHKPGWTGYTFDPDCFPDPSGFLARLKQRGLKITFNLHPADGVGDHEDAFPTFANALQDKARHLEKVPPAANRYQAATKRFRFDPTDPDFMRAYFDVLHRPLEKMGVDFWWMDWQQGTSSKIAGLDPLPWLNLLHMRDQQENPDRRGQRPLIFSRFGGLGSGRLPIGFSGDTIIAWESLAYQPEFTATAANVLFGYWSHDIGGHYGGNLDGELYARWMQWGMLSPILRTHATKRANAERRPWTFPEPWSRIIEQCLVRRYELVPYIAAACRQAWDTGLSPCRPLYLHHPEVPEAYRHADQYYLGPDLLCAPVVAPADADTLLARRPLWLPAGLWYDTARGEMIKGGRHIRWYAASESPVFVRPGTIIWEQVAPQRLEPGSFPCPVVVCHPGGDGTGALYEDDGLSEDYKNGKSITMTATQKVAKATRTITLDPAQGDFAGFQSHRPVEIHLPGTMPPASIAVDGREIPWRPELATDATQDAWTWDRDEIRVRIRLAQVDLRQRTTAVITGAPAAPNGLLGLLRRLEQLMTWTKMHSPCHAIHAEERLPIGLAQTAHRIALRPRTAARELVDLRKGLARLDAVLAFHAKALPETEWPRARRLLAGVRRDFPSWFARRRTVPAR